MCPRKYDARRRNAASQATRSRILEATASIVGGKGDLDEFSMDAVARKAGVARMTVYYQFHSREELLSALADHLAERGGMHRLREAFAEPDPEKAVRRLVDVFVGFWATDRLTIRRMRAMAVVFPSKDKGPRERDSWRREAIVTLLDRFPKRARSPKGLPADELIDLLSTLTSFETFDALCTPRRSSEDVAKLLGDTAGLLCRAQYGP